MCEALKQGLLSMQQRKLQKSAYSADKNSEAARNTAFEPRRTRSNAHSLSGHARRLSGC